VNAPDGGITLEIWRQPNGQRAAAHAGSRIAPAQQSLLQQILADVISGFNNQVAVSGESFEMMLADSLGWRNDFTQRRKDAKKSIL